MGHDVKKTDVKKTDIEPAVLPTEIVTLVPVAPTVIEPRKNRAYDRIKVALKILGLGHFEFERVHDDRA